MIAFIMFGTAVLHGAFYISCDAGLYWLLDMLKRHGRLTVTETSEYSLFDTFLYLYLIRLSCSILHIGRLCSA